MRPFTRAMKLIEVGPSYNPIAPKADGWDTYIVDHASQTELRQKYKAQEVTRIEPVDAIWAGGSIDKAIPSHLHGVFDGLIASHAAEHFPDLIGFLQSAAKLLKPSGVISLALPDLRVCFDFFQPHSTTGDLLDARTNKRVRHRKGRIFDEYAYYAKQGDAIVWLHDDYTPRDFHLVHDLKTAFQQFQKASENDDAPYTDCHAWTFTPNSFALAMLELYALEQIPFVVTNLESASGAEFYVTLAVSPSALSSDSPQPFPVVGKPTEAAIEMQRLDLLKKVICEREEQIKRLRPATTVSAPQVNGSMMTVAAIIPLYNGAAYIETSLRSILAQTHPADQIFVVNDGSTDNGPAIVEQIAAQNPKVVLLNMSTPGNNLGQSAARNFGVSKSSTELIALLDQDDKWYPHHLATLLEKFVAESAGGEEVGWVYSNLDEVDGDLNMVWRDFLSSVSAPHPKETLLACLGGDMFVLPSSSLLSRSALQKVGGFDERLCGYEDDDLFLRLFQAGYRNYYIPESLTQWRIHTTSTSYSPRMANSRRIYMQKLIDKFPDDRIRQRYYRRDVLVPRFLAQTLSDFRKAVESNDDALIETRRQDVLYITSYLEGYKRFMLRAVMQTFRSRTIVKQYYANRWLFLPFIRMLRI
jgi:glycosyltransferase involved in cell wall biosynthesis/SAM-dependent methyltransferase